MKLHDFINVIKSHDPLSAVAKLHKLSYDLIPGGALIVTDSNDMTMTWHLCASPRMLDTLSFCNDKMHFELIGRPPVIIFNTKKSIEEIGVALFSKTGFSKPSEFTAYYVMYQEKQDIMGSIIDKTKGFFKWITNTN
ncbi:hypothetical protein UGMREWDR_CDS0185 [Aeromonas phage GomatiRiver_11]|nr:hypothetical protein OBDJBBDK_00174 [Aeromonas phage AhFM11]WKW84352.1 hypothetical protein UGMREWDR_CDS0185 [Aeromonas phage GomatiRiver_11]